MTVLWLPRLYFLTPFVILKTGQFWTFSENTRFLGCLPPKVVFSHFGIQDNTPPSLSLPFVRWGGTKEAYVSGVPTRPANLYAFPSDLWAPLDHSTVWTYCNTAIHNVVGPVQPTKKNRDTIAEARAHLDRRYATQKLSVDQQVYRHMAITKFRDQAGIDKVGPKKGKRRSRVGAVFGP